MTVTAGRQSCGAPCRGCGPAGAREPQGAWTQADPVAVALHAYGQAPRAAVRVLRFTEHLPQFPGSAAWTARGRGRAASAGSQERRATKGRGGRSAETGTAACGATPWPEMARAGPLCGPRAVPAACRPLAGRPTVGTVST